MQSNNTRYYIVTCTCIDNTSQKWFTWSSRLIEEDKIEHTIDTFHARQIDKNCSLEAVRITSSDDPRFPSSWENLVKNKQITFKSKFNSIALEFADSLQIEVRLESEAYKARRRDALILHAQKLSEARAIMEAKTHAE